MKKRSRFYPRVRVDTAGVPAVGAGRWGAADRHGRRRRSGRGAVGGAGAVAQAAGGPRPGQGRPGSGGDAGVGRGLPGRHRAAARRARRVRPGGLGSDGVPHDRRAGRRRARGAGGDRHARGPRRGPRVWALAGEHAPDHAVDADGAAGHRHRRHPGHRALGEGARGADVQARVRASTRCGRSSTTAPTAPGNRWRCCCAPGNAGSNTAADHIAVARARAGAAARAPAGDPARAARC